MKNAFIYTQPRLASLSWYIWLFVVGFASLGNKCGCQMNAPIDNTSTTNTPPTLSLQFEKLSYDRNNSRLIVIIKNAEKETAKNLSLRCTNISQDETSCTAVRFNNTPTKTILSIPDLEAGSSTQEIYVAIDFQTAKEALVQMEVLGGQQVATTNAIQVNRFPIDLLPKERIILIAKQGETREFKWKLVTDPHEPSIDFTKFQLILSKEQGKDMIVSVESMGTILDESINSKILTGADLEKLAKQQEIVVEVKNNKPDNLNCIAFALLGNGENIASDLIALAPEVKEALLPAVVYGNVNLVKQAIADGADINIKNTDDNSVLHLATEYGHQEILQILLKNRANVNVTDATGGTALHRAANKGYLEIAKLLLQYGADKNIKNNNGETAADLAKDQHIKNLINNWKN